MTPYFAETWFFLALPNDRDQSHEEVDLWAESLRRPLLTTEFVIVETGDGLAAPSRRAKFSAFFHGLHSGNDVTVIPAGSTLLRRGHELFESRPDKCWSLTDCISFATMRRLRPQEALTADRHFEQAGFTAVFGR